MRNALSSRYARAFVEALGENRCKELLEKHEEIKVLYTQEEFRAILDNPFVDSQKKTQIVLEILKINDAKIRAGVEVLGSARRLEIFPNILSEIADMFATNQQIYQAILYSKAKTSPDLIEKISNTLSSRIGGKVIMVEKLWEKDGVKCVIEDLDLEISFSQDAFVGNLKEYILNTFRKGV